MYLDTNILIYLLEGNEQYSGAIADILQDYTQNDAPLITSVITITEFLAGTSAPNTDIIHHIPGLVFHGIDERLAEEAALIQRKTNLHIGDAIHLATAIHVKADRFFTHDARLRKAAAQYFPVQNIES